MSSITWPFRPSYARSPVSSIQIGARHPNTAIDNVPANQQILFDAVVKFRANAQEDAIGVQPDPGVPYHVPWVWCETLVTYDPSRRICTLYGRGSIFPSHSWFANSTRVAFIPQNFDTSFPVFSGTKIIRESDMILTSFFKQGAPATGSQTTLSSESGLVGAVDTHPNAAPGGSTIIQTITI